MDRESRAKGAARARATMMLRSTERRIMTKLENGVILGRTSRISSAEFLMMMMMMMMKCESRRCRTSELKARYVRYMYYLIYTHNP